MDNNNKHVPRAKEINLREYYLLIKKRIWIVIVLTILTTVAGYYYNNSTYVPLYQTSTRIIVGSGGDNMQTLMVLIKDPIILGKVRDDLQLNTSIDAISNQISVNQIDSSQVILISVVHTDPEMAAKIANSTASIYKEEIAEILDFNQVQLLSEAQPKYFPINGKSNGLSILAFLAGIVGGVGIIFLLDILDNTVRKESEVEDILEVPVLGIVSNMNKRNYVLKEVKRVKKEEMDMDVRSDTVAVK